MWTRTLRNGFIASSVGLALGAGALTAQSDTTSYPRLVWGGAGGLGGVGIACAGCEEWQGSTAPYLEMHGGADLTRSVRVLVSGGWSSASSGQLKGDVRWTMAGLRLQPPFLGALYFQGAAGVAMADVRKEHQGPCGTLCKIMTFGLGGDEITITDFETSVREPVFEAAIGADLKMSRRVSFTPQVSAMLGRVTVTGVSLGFSAR